jgi:hypothetical protein
MKPFQILEVVLLLRVAKTTKQVPLPEKKNAKKPNAVRDRPSHFWIHPETNP